jgi:hypothetical protein
MPPKSANIRSQSLKERLPSSSIHGFAVGWKSSKSERAAVRELITELEDKRALYSQAVWEEPAHVIQSLFTIRDRLTDNLKRVDERSPPKSPEWKRLCIGPPLSFRVRNFLILPARSISARCQLDSFERLVDVDVERRPQRL